MRYRSAITITALAFAAIALVPLGAQQPRPGSSTSAAPPARSGPDDRIRNPAANPEIDEKGNDRTRTIDRADDHGALQGTDRSAQPADREPTDDTPTGTVGRRDAAEQEPAAALPWVLAILGVAVLGGVAGWWWSAGRGSA